LALEKVKKSSLVYDIAKQIEDAIISGVYKPGEKIPTLQNLQESLGASLGTTREALRILEQKGLIGVRLGSKGGPYVRESGTEPVSESLGLLIRQQKVSLSELAEFRKVVEAGLIRLVAQNATKKDIEELKKYLLEFQKVISKGIDGWEEYLLKEIKLRKVLIRIAGNRMFEAVLVPLHDNILGFALIHIPFEKANPSEAYQDWFRIIEAVERRDPDTAEKVTKAHIERYADLVNVDQRNN
jgi:DNA-binding FadR family transcriptional regulator